MVKKLACWSRGFWLGMGLTVGIPAGAIDEPSTVMMQKTGRVHVPMVLIPAGSFVMGSDKKETTGRAVEFGNVKPWYLDEHPQHRVSLPAFFIDKYEVTNAQYREFVKAVNVQPPSVWIENGYVVSLRKEKLLQADDASLRKVAAEVFRLDLDTDALSRRQLLDAIGKRLAYLDTVPVTYVSWYDADAFCRWAGKRLPTEEEWERVARGTTGREFPWGQEWKPAVSHAGDEEPEDGPAPVGTHEMDRGPDGVMDLAGNVSEWVADWYQAYDHSDYQSKDFGQIYKVVRGAGWSGGAGHYALKLFQRGAYRFNLPPDGRFDDVGFRCAMPANHAKKTK